MRNSWNHLKQGKRPLKDVQRLELENGCWKFPAANRANAADEKSSAADY
jgi:hypothetical protein